MSHESSVPSTLYEVTASMHAVFVDVCAAREKGLVLSRQVIQHSSRSIRAIHRRDVSSAKSALEEAGRVTRELRELFETHPSLYWAGYVHDSQKEYVEAAVMYAIVQRQAIPSPQELAVELPAYLNGLAEAASESRRYVLDLLREQNTGAAQQVLGMMDDIYFELITFDFPDAVTGGLRRTTDSLRAVLERTRADLTVTLVQQRFQESLQLFQERMQTDQT